MAKSITWFGPFEGSGAYPTINRQLSAAMERRGWRVLRNQHNDGARLTDVAVSHIYPPRAINVKHDLNVTLTAWEFAGPRALPAAFVAPLQSYDVVCAPTKWTAGVIGENIKRDVQVVPWGIDRAEFTPRGNKYQLDTDGLIPVLWAGGTDQRHGFDIALHVIEQLPDCALVAKQSIHYPAHVVSHPRVLIIRDDLPSLAPLYRACRVFLHSARGVGFALHVIEAMGCGLPVAATPLPAIMDFAGDYAVFSSGGKWEYFEHHINSDCLPQWYEPNVGSLAQATLKALAVGKQNWGAGWTWDDSAAKLEKVIENAP